jgi:hypothetical protein
MNGRFLRIAFALLVAAALQGCDGRTYVVVQIDRGAATPEGIVSIDLGLMLAGRSDKTVLREHDGRPLAFPTSTTLEIRSGTGTLMVNAVARDAAGAAVDGATGSVTVAAGGTARLSLQLGGGVTLPDLGPAGDGAPPDMAGPALPGAPTGVLASSGIASATVSWSPPASDGGSPIVGYTVTASPGNAMVTVDGATRMATLTGLTNGTTYTFTVAATNATGTGPASAPSNAVTPLATALPPGPPGTPVAVLNGTRAVLVTWSAANNNASPITAYTVTSSPGNISVMTNGTTLSATVSGLVTGTAYTFTVTATNAAGTGPASAPSNAIEPADPPNAPGMPTATAVAPNAASVSWPATTTNGAPVTNYTVTSSPGGFSATTADGNTLTATVSGLANGVSYTFSVRASSAAGTGAPSAPSNAITAADVPTAPTSVTASAAKGFQAAVGWAASTARGSAITGYTVTSSPGGLIATSNGNMLTATVSGLAEGTSYTFTVKANSAIGASAPSSPSGSMTGSDVPNAPAMPTAVGNAADHITVSWSAPATHGVPITSYTVTSSPSHLNGTVTTGNGATLSAQLGPLTNGVSYTFTVVANSSLGASGSSPPSNGVTAGDVPAAPTNVVACPANGGLNLRYSTSNGVSSVNAYYASAPGVTPANGTKVTGASFIPSLSNGTTYYVVVTALNAYGESSPSGQVAAAPSSAMHDTLVVGVPGGVQFWDCFSQFPSNASSGFRAVSSSAMSSVGSGGFYVDGASGTLYVSDTNHGSINAWTGITNLASSNPTPTKTLGPGGNTGLINPGPLVAAAGVLYVGDPFAGSILTYPTNWSSSSTSPSATVLVGLSEMDQLAIANDELWAAAGSKVVGWKNVSGWSGNSGNTGDVQITVSGGTNQYLGVAADATNDVIYFSLNRNGSPSVAWPTQSASGLSGTVTLNPWNATGTEGTTDTLVGLGGNILFTTDSGTGTGTVYVWTANSAGGNLPYETVSPGASLSGLVYIP